VLFASFGCASGVVRTIAGGVPSQLQPRRMQNRCDQTRQLTLRRGRGSDLHSCAEQHKLDWAVEVFEGSKHLRIQIDDDVLKASFGMLAGSGIQGQQLPSTHCLLSAGS
jgi:hypothetical protein